MKLLFRENPQMAKAKKFQLQNSLNIFLMPLSSRLNARVFRKNVVSAAFSSYMYEEKAAETSFVQCHQGEVAGGQKRPK